MMYGYYNVDTPRFLREERKSMVVGFITVVIIVLLGMRFISKPAPVKIISPCPDTGCQSRSIPEPTTSPIAPQRPTSGKASWYSVDGCIGCNPQRIMANGQRLDDTRLTIAYNHAPLNTQVKIRNTKTKATVVAVITDRGGFERYGKIADLSLATRDALGCGDVCPIELVW